MKWKKGRKKEKENFSRSTQSRAQFSKVRCQSDISMSQQRHLLSVTDIQNTRAILVLREYNMHGKQKFASLLVRIKFSSEYLPFQSKETHCLRYNSCLTSTHNAHTHTEWRIRLFHFGHISSYFSSYLFILSSFFTIDC